MNKTKPGYPGTYSLQMKRNARRRKKKLVRSFLILLGVFMVVGVILSKGKIERFITVLLLEAAAAVVLAGLASYFRSKSRKKVKKASTCEIGIDRKVDSIQASRSTRRNEERSTGYYKKRSNFDWVLDKKVETAGIKEVEPEAEIRNPVREIKEERKFVPYRSPFDPINPVSKPVEPVMEEVKGVVSIEGYEKQEADIKNENESVEADEAPEINQGSIDSGFEEYIADVSIVFDDETADSTEVEENEPGVDEYDLDGKADEQQFYVKAVETAALCEINKETDNIISRVEPEVMIPSTDLLKRQEAIDRDMPVVSEVDYNSRKLVETLASFGVGVRVVNVSKGPVVTRYELQPNTGVKVSKIVNLSDDIALNLAATAVRIEAPIPGKAAIGIEIPNKEVTPVLLRDVIESAEFARYPSKLAFAVGKDISGNTVVADIAKMPHLLIAGATGSGKSVCINTLITSILYKASPSEVKLLMIDPKVVELNVYNGIPHLLIPVVTDPKKAAGALNWAIQEMLSRYKLFADNNVRDLKGYNNMVRHKEEGEVLPQIVIIIDELADLMMAAPNDVEDYICRLAQMARAAGMHLVIATQRPSVDVITGVIKANIPSRISFAVTSQVDSRTILDMAGAEKLLGRGDMLFNPIGKPKPIRVQGAFISDKEVEAVVEHLKSASTVEYDEEILQKIEKTSEPAQVESDGDDELLQQAIDMVIECGQASSSLIQRKFKVGYARAARIVDQMEAWGVVSASDGSSKPRRILVTRQEWEELNA